MSCNASEKKILVGSSVSSSSRFMSSSYASPSESAFWKIDGFEVTPVTASSSIILFNSPLRTRLRESVSNQTAWPRAASLCSGDVLAMLHLLFHLFHLAEAGDIAFASVETCAQKGVDELASQRRPDDL